MNGGPYPGTIIFICDYCYHYQMDQDYELRKKIMTILYGDDYNGK